MSSHFQPQVQRPSRGGLLVDPYCNINTWWCYPNFNTQPQNSDRECGLATILREHIVNPFNCTALTTNAQRQALGRGTAGPASGVGGGASGYGVGCSSYAGTKVRSSWQGWGREDCCFTFAMKPLW